MKYEVLLSRFAREWMVEAFNADGEGESYLAAFSGPEAKARAIEYASWKNSQDRYPIRSKPSSISLSQQNARCCHLMRNELAHDVLVKRIRLRRFGKLRVVIGLQTSC